MTKILVVDDDRATTGLLKTVFEMEGFRTVLCPDPKRVMSVARQEKPDLIFMDFYLAETISLPILREIKEDETLQGTLVIMTSGLDHGEECKQAGADSFVLKPFRPTGLMKEIRAVLEK